MTILINAGDVRKSLLKEKDCRPLFLHSPIRLVPRSLLLHAARGGIVEGMRFTRWTAAII